MRCEGRWLVCHDHITRPVIEVGLVDPDGRSESYTFLIDTGADATVLTFVAVAHLGVEVVPSKRPMEGIGGPTPAVEFVAELYVLNTARELVRLRGNVLGKSRPVEHDLCVLGRDLLNNFAVIVDRPADTVCLLSGRHRYVIQES
jgi:hypothetical protein